MIHKIQIPIICLAIILTMVGCSSTTDTEKTAHDEQFVEVQLQYGFVDELNTFEGTFTKDLVMDGSITVEFWLSNEDQESIKELVDQLSFFSLPNYIPAESGVMVEPNPSPDSLRIRLGSIDKTVVWFYPLDMENTDSKNLIELSNYIMFIVQKSDIYKALPEARGGRL